MFIFVDDIKLMTMRRAFFFALSLSLLILGCESREDKLPEEGADPRQEYVELIQAYDDGKILSSAAHQDDGCLITFADDSELMIHRTSFQIHDCTEAEPAKVEFSGNMWKVDGELTDIKIDIAASDKDAFPVYVYFDAKTLYAHISNSKLLKFNSKVLIQEEEDRKAQEEEDARREEEEEQKAKEELERRQNIPVIYVNTGGKPIVDKKNYVDGTITIKDPGKLYNDVEEITLDMGIRGRGNSTWGFPKKPYKVKLKEKASLMGMPADKEWCLLANYADRTLLRNIVAMKLSEICGFSWTPRMVSVEVHLNGKYQGVYTFCEHKKVSADRVNIDLDAGDCYLEIEQQQDETTCWWTGMRVPMMFSDPEVPSDEQLAYIKKYFEDFEASLYSPDFADPEKGYAAYIDVDSFIDYFIVQELSKNTDGNLRKSSFITKENGKKLEMYHLWDFDLTFGNSGWVMHDPEGWWVKDYDPSCNIGDNWFNRMFRDPAFVAKVQARWNELLPQLEAIPDFIDEQALYLDKAKTRNFGVWSIWESVDWVDCPSLGSYEKEIGFFKEFYTKRVAWMTKALNSL